MTHAELTSPIPNSGLRRVIGREAGSIDVKDPDFHRDPNRYERLKYLRDNHPVYWNAEDGAPGFWGVMRFDDVEAVTRDRDIFSTDYMRGGMRIFDVKDVQPNPRPDIFSTDPPDHTDFRKAFSPIFTPAVIASFKDGVRRRARRLIANIAGRGRAELVSEIASPIAAGLLSDLLEVPESDGPHFMKWSSALIGDDDPDTCPSLEHRIECVRALDRYVADLARERAGSDRTDILTIMTRVSLDGKPLDVLGVCESFASFIVATNETTRHTIGRSMATLTEFPDERAKLQADLSIMPAAVKELVRWATPLIHARRTATRDTVLAGQKIEEGDKVVLWYQSANRDERRWPDAAQFRIDRYCSKDAPAHIAFGSGINHCLGWRYAEMQIAVLFEELLAALPDIRMVGEPRILRSNFVAGITSLDVEFTPVSYRA
jgi:linalool 8-monooxygenase